MAEYYELKKQFGASVKARRKQLGITQAQLGKRAELCRCYISDVERRERNISLEKVEEIAQALDVSCATLFS